MVTVTPAPSLPPALPPALPLPNTSVQCIADLHNSNSKSTSMTSYIEYIVGYTTPVTSYIEQADYMAEDPGFKNVGHLINWQGDWLGAATHRDHHELPGR